MKLLYFLLHYLYSFAFNYILFFLTEKKWQQHIALLKSKWYTNSCRAQMPAVVSWEAANWSLPCHIRSPTCGTHNHNAAARKACGHLPSLHLLSLHLKWLLSHLSWFDSTPAGGGLIHHAPWTDKACACQIHGEFFGSGSFSAKSNCIPFVAINSFSQWRECSWKNTSCVLTTATVC